MKPSDFTIRIPEPCHEDWSAMQPDVKGKFCNSCHKSVHDFTTKTDIEIHNILLENKGQQVCGHFKKTQVNRPLNIRIDLNELPKNMSITKLFAIALFVVFGTILFSCTNDKGEKISSIELTKPLNEQENRIMGDISFVPPAMMIDSGMSITVDIQAIEPSYYLQNHIAGGIGYNDIIVLEKDSIRLPEPTDSVEHVEHMLGMMAYEPVDSIPVNDSINNATKKTTQEQAIKTSAIFTVYPNPTTGEFTIKYDVLKRADIHISILDINGARIKEVVAISQQHEGQYYVAVNLNELSNGIYIVKLLNNSELKTERLVIAR